MVKIIVALSDPARCAQYASVLEEAGMQVFRHCNAGSEVLRAFNDCQDGIVVCGARLPDMTADQMAYDLGDKALLLVAAKPELLSLCEHPSIFKLPAPFSRAELISAMNMLVQLHQMRMPRRSEDEKQLIGEAKLRMMSAYGLSEAEAHRILQRASMNAGVKLVESARRVLEGVDVR